MSGLGGVTHGHQWASHEFVENHRRLDINALHRTGALIPGGATTWQWENGLKAIVRALPVGAPRAASAEIILDVANRTQTIGVDWLPFLNEHYVRPRFLCPRCQAGCYNLLDKRGAFLCRRCCRYDWRSRHRQRSSPAYRRIAKLRAKLGADPRPLSSLPPRPRWRMSRLYYDRLAAALAREEAAAHADIGRLRADFEQRIKP